MNTALATLRYTPDLDYFGPDALTMETKDPSAVAAHWILRRVRHTRTDAKALLDHNPSPTRADVVNAIAGNICRCTGYEPIINAVLAAASGGRARA